MLSRGKEGEERRGLLVGEQDEDDEGDNNIGPPREEESEDGGGIIGAGASVETLGTIDTSAKPLEGPRPLSEDGRGSGVSKWSIVSVVILTFINLLNYMDRYSIAGVLDDLQKFYGINDTLAGLLSTTFIISYMCLSPVFGYLGDRYNRKRIMSVGIFIWSSVTLASSFVPQHYFPVFLVLRMFVGIGEASYSTIAPTILADLFSGTQRTKSLSVFYFAIPVGSGLGYITGSAVAKFAGSWQWALRVTPIFGISSSILILILVREPERGAADQSTNLHATSWAEDIRYLLTHKSFMLSSLGVTCVAFVTGALAFWAPKYITKSILVSHPNVQESQIATRVAMTFGGITCAAGFLGVMLGSVSASKLRPYTGKADPFVCAFGLLCSAPFLFFSLFLSRYDENVTWVLIFLGETLLCLNWPIVADILLYLVIPTRRSSAEAIQILLSHLLGDAGSPFLVGAISDEVRSRYKSDDPIVQYLGLEYALYMTTFVCVLGGGFFLFCAIYIERDRSQTERIEHEALEEQSFVNEEVVEESSTANPLSINVPSECI